MTEYGRGVAEGAGQFSGSAGGGGGGGGDLGLELGRMVGDAVDTVVRLPTEQLILLVAVLAVGFWIFRRAL